jgi:hypothetical protein
MRLDDCLQLAINAGKLDPALGRRAQEKYRDRVKRHVDQGHPAPLAESMAADEVADSITRENKSIRHATLLQLKVMQENEARYGNVHTDNPDLILKDIEKAESQRKALKKSFMSGIHDFLAQHKTNLLGEVQNRAKLIHIVMELHGQDSGNAAAKALAGAVLKQYERARALANALGADIPKLADWGMQHTHDARKVAEARHSGLTGFDAWFAWLYDDRALDWHRIINHDTGKPFAVAAGGRPLRADAEEFLRPIFQTITSNGWNDRTPAMHITGRSPAKARADHRVLHFTDAEAWMKYNDAFGTMNPFDTIVAHFENMARDIALMRAFGPNPKMGLTHATQVIEKAAATDPAISGEKRLKIIARNQRKAKKAQVMLKAITGETNRPSDEFWARFLAGTRNLLTAAQLGSASLSTVTDWASARVAARAIGLNPNSHTQAMLRQIMGGFSAQQAKDMGFIFDTWFDTGSAAARMVGDVWAPEVTSRITNAVLRGSGLSFLTDRSRVAIAAAFGSDLADMAGKSFADLPVNLRNFMGSRDIGAREWDALRHPSAMYTDPTGGRHINQTWFREHTSLGFAEAEDIALKWGGLVEDHLEHAIPTASLRGRASWLGDAPPGTLLGELGRSGFMYKSFSLSVLFNHIRRVQELDGGLPAHLGFVVHYAAMMTLAGSLAVQLKEIAKGRDPRPMDDWRFWGAAMLQGGGVGIFGDFFNANTSRTGGGMFETFGGPVVGVAGDIGRAIASNAQRAAEGKPILLGRDVANFVRRYNPLATFQPPVPIPFRAAGERILGDHMLMFFDPEYPAQFRQAEARQMKDFGNAHWWGRGEMLPARAPDLSAATLPFTGANQ